MNSLDTTTSAAPLTRKETVKSVYKSGLYIFNFVSLCVLALFSAAVVITHLVSALLVLVSGSSGLGMNKMADFVGGGLGYIIAIAVYIVTPFVLISSLRYVIKLIKTREKPELISVIIRAVITFVSSVIVGRMVYVVVRILIATFKKEEVTVTLSISEKTAHCIGFLALAALFSLVLAACVYGIIASVKLMKNSDITGVHINRIGKAKSVLHLFSVLKCVDCAVIGFVLLLPAIAYPKTTSLLNIETIFSSLGLSGLYENLNVAKIFESISGAYNSVVTGIFGIIEGIFNGIGLASVYESLDIPRIAVHLSSSAMVLAFVALVVIVYGILQIVMFASFKNYYYVLENVVGNENYVAEKNAPFVLPIVYTSLYGIGAILMFINGSWITAFFCIANAVYVISASLFLRKMHKNIGVKKEKAPRQKISFKIDFSRFKRKKTDIG